MADVLRVSKVRAFGDRPATEAYVTRVTDRPAFQKARADQLAHFRRSRREQISAAVNRYCCYRLS
jgi:glutathione S-transferase